MAKDDEEDGRERESVDENENSTIGDDEDDEQRDVGAAAGVAEGESDARDDDDEEDDDEGDDAEARVNADEASKKRRKRDDDAKVVAAKPKEAEKPKSKLMGNLVFAVAFLAVLGLGYVAGQQVKRFFRDPTELVTGDRYSVKLRGDEPQLGPDDALVTIIQYSDFQCPYCAKAAGPLVAEVEP